MKVRFESERLRVLGLGLASADDDPDAGEVGLAFRKRVNQIVAAQDEGVLKALQSTHLKQLKGDRKHQYSMRLNGKRRMIMEIEERSSKSIIVRGIEDR